MPLRMPLRRKLRLGASQLRVAGRFALELLIVFVGVYAAFVLSDFRERRELDERQAQLRDALVREIGEIVEISARVAVTMPAMLAELDEAIASGERPPLQPLIEPARAQAHMWTATLQSGGVDLFDVETIYRLSAFYNELNAGFEQLAQLRSLSETVLLPNLGKESDEFYDPLTGELRPKYQWYRSGIARLAQYAENITVQGRQLVHDMAPDSSQSD